MATQKPISTISYNTESFLREKLEELYKAHIICAFQYIKHIGEDGDKDHIHLRIEPNRRLDTMDLNERFCEWIQGESLPRRCRPFRPAKEEDWYLYVVHDADYLRLKYGTDGDSDGKIPYDWQEIQVSDGYDLQCAFVRAKASLKHSASSLIRRFRDGDNALDMVAEGANPFTVSSIAKLLSSNEYGVLSQKCHELEDEISKLDGAIRRAGFSVCVDGDGKYFLVPTEQTDTYTSVDVTDALEIFK